VSHAVLAAVRASVFRGDLAITDNRSAIPRAIAVTKAIVQHAGIGMGIFVHRPAAAPTVTVFSVLKGRAKRLIVLALHNQALCLYTGALRRLLVQKSISSAASTPDYGARAQMAHSAFPAMPAR